MRKRLGWLAVIIAVFSTGYASAQSAIPDGSFVRDSEDNVWFITGNQRVAVPIRKADDEEILAVPFGNRWLVGAPDGLVTFGSRPDWAKDPEPVKLPDDPPKVMIQLSDDDVARGTTIQITVSATDDISLDWIEWEGEIDGRGQATDDPALTTIHRFECNGQKTCTNTMPITLTGQGEYVITARARDLTGQRSDATADLKVR